MSAVASADITLNGPGTIALRRMANLLAAAAPHDGVFPLRLPGTFAARLSQATSKPNQSTIGPALCIVAQGAKVVMLGRDVLQYDPANILVCTSGARPMACSTRSLACSS